MLKHIRDFESYLSSHYGVEGFPLDYNVQPKLAHLPWQMMNQQNLRGNVHNPYPDFFQVEETDFNSHRFAQIVYDRDNYYVQTKNPTVLAQWETGNKSNSWTNTFRHDDEIIQKNKTVCFYFLNYLMYIALFDRV